MNPLLTIQDAYEDGKCSQENLSDSELRKMYLEFTGVNKNNVESFVNAHKQGRKRNNKFK